MISKILPVGILYFVSCFIFKVKAADSSLGRGFGDHISWFTLDKALAEAKAQNLPIMVVIHKSWCGACKALKPKFAASEEIAKLSKNFVMVNVEDDEEPKKKEFSPDGGYIPRILFLSPDGNVQKNYYNSNGNPKYKYFYSDPQSIAITMKMVLRAFSGHVQDEL